jgi:hypothetical protein
LLQLVAASLPWGSGLKLLLDYWLFLLRMNWMTYCFVQIPVHIGNVRDQVQVKHCKGNFLLALANHFTSRTILSARRLLSHHIFMICMILGVEQPSIYGRIINELSLSETSH